jgi:hypothetical protein
MLLQLALHQKQAALLQKLEAEARTARQRFTDAFTVAVAGAGFGEGTVFQGLTNDPEGRTVLLVEDPNFKADENGVSEKVEPPAE